MKSLYFKILSFSMMLILNFGHITAKKTSSTSETEVVKTTENPPKKVFTKKEIQSWNSCQFATQAQNAVYGSTLCKGWCGFGTSAPLNVECLSWGNKPKMDGTHIWQEELSFHEIPVFTKKVCWPNSIVKVTCTVDSGKTEPDCEITSYNCG